MKTLLSKMTLTLSVCVCIAVVAILAVDYFFINKLVTSNSTLAMQSTAEELALNVNEQVSGVEQSVRTMFDYSMELMRNNPDILENEANIKQFVTDFELFAQIEGENTYGAITTYFALNPYEYGRRKGFFLTRNSLEEPFESVRMTNILAYAEGDLEHVGWYYIPIQNGGPMWMSPYLNRNINVWMTSYVIPMFDNDGHVLGITGMDLDFRVVLEELQNTYVYSENGSAVLFDASGNLLYQRDFPTALGDDDEVLKGGLDIYAPDEQQDIINLYNAAQASIESGDASQSIWKGQPYRIIGSKVKNGMTLVTMAPESEVQAPVWEHLAMCAGVAMLIALLAFVAMAIATRSVTRPLRRLADASREISEGNLDLNIESSSKDEVGQLAKSFQKMADDLREQMEEIHRMALRDPLTGIGNRTAYMNMLADIKEDIANGKAVFTLAVFDLNGLKQANDTYGHEAGDALIIDAAQVISSVFGENRVFRYGGDEFTALVIGDNSEDTGEWSERVRAGIDKFNADNALTNGMVSRPYTMPLSIAWGIAAYDPARHNSYEDTFAEADSQMYRNKTLRRK